MTDEAQAAEAPMSAEPEMSPEAKMMAAIDEALAPALNHANGIGTASLNDMGVMVRAFRQAMSCLVYGPPERPAGAESLDELANSQHPGSPVEPNPAEPPATAEG